MSIIKRFAFLFISACTFVHSVLAETDAPDVKGWGETAYWADGWLTYGMRPAYTDGSMKFETGISSAFILSPNYSTPIRKIALMASCRSKTAKRTFQVFPFVDGVQVAENSSLTVSDPRPVEEIEQNVEQPVIFDFPLSANVTAFRLGLGASSGDTWSLSRICVFLGEKTDEDDAMLREFAAMLPTPENPRVADFSETMLSLAADPVEFATGYVFKVESLLENSRTELLHGTVVEKPELKLESLESGRYAFQVKAVGEGFRDSTWTAEQVIDLNWVNAQVASPTGVEATYEDGRLVIGWAAASGADHYLVDVLTVGEPHETVLARKRADGTRLVLSENDLDGLGDYLVRVTAVAPGGKNTADSDALQISVKLGAVATVTASALDAQTIEVSWAKVAFAESYAVRVFALGGSATKVVSDYSTMPENWPKGMTHHAEWRAGDYWKKDGVSFPKFGFKNEWLAIGDLPDRATRLEVAVKSGSSSAAVLSTQALAVYVSSSDGEETWRKVDDIAVDSTAQITRTFVFGSGEDVRRIKFVADSTSDVTAPNIQFGKFTVTCGEQTKDLVKTVTAYETKAVVTGLSSDFAYVAEVTPRPGDDLELTGRSGEVDLTLLKPRIVEPVSLRRCKDVGYSCDYSGLVGLKAAVLVRELAVSNWQFRVDGAEPQKLSYTATGGSTAAGVFVVSDTNRSEKSYMFATHATGSSGAMIGLAFLNDGTFTATEPRLSFVAVQRSFQKTAKSQIVEWLVTDGETGIDAGGAWTAVVLDGLTAPVTTADRQEGQTECRTTFELDLVGAEVAPGHALIVRWRDEAQASSPMMGVGDVKLGFGTKYEDGFSLIVK